jgi:hypothetical protein
LDCAEWQNDSTHLGRRKGLPAELAGPPEGVQNISQRWGSKKRTFVTLEEEGALPKNMTRRVAGHTPGGLMRRVSKGLATASLIAVLAASNIYAVPSRDGSQPSIGSKIVRIIRHIVGLDDWSWPKP